MTLIMGFRKPWILDSPPAPPYTDDGNYVLRISRDSSAVHDVRRPLLSKSQPDIVLSGFGNLPPWNDKMSVAKYGKELRQRRSKLGRKPIASASGQASTPPSTPTSPTHGKENISQPATQPSASVNMTRNTVLGVSRYRPRPKPVPAANRIRSTSCPIVLNSVDDLIALVIPKTESVPTQDPDYRRPLNPSIPSTPRSKRIVSQPLVTIPSTPDFDADTGSESDEDEMPPTPQLDEDAPLPLVADRKADITAKSQFAFLSPSSPQFTSSPVNPIQRASCLGIAGSHRAYRGPVPPSGDDEMEATLETLRRKKTLIPNTAPTMKLMSRYTRKPIPSWD